MFPFPVPPSSGRAQLKYPFPLLCILMFFIFTVFYSYFFHFVMYKSASEH